MEKAINILAHYQYQPLQLIQTKLMSQEINELIDVVLKQYIENK